MVMAFNGNTGPNTGPLSGTGTSGGSSGGSGYNSAAEQLFQQLRDLNSYSETTKQGQLSSLDQVGSQFKNLFKNFVGRDATPEELDTFYSQEGGRAITSAPLGRANDDAANIRNRIASYVGDTYQGAAQDYATQQLQGQQGQANDLANLFRTQGNEAISQTENSLLDYQNRLFERLRPNLITSLQAQGLLNTGALNESLAGAQGDLANEAQRQIMDMHYQNEQGANAIAYGGAAAPYQFQQQQITNRPGVLQQNGADALNKTFQTYMSNLDYNHQVGLLSLQNKFAQGNKPSFLSTLGQSTAQGMGNSFGQWFSPSTAKSAYSMGA